ncbi:iron-sulfur cluster biosynthesis family protein [Alteribacter populi]|uniref:iron-sulfur cluster biosynthesis family protein n=1 Tax=Alteribacter populi TaxID=2011011 RepID=UPI000BBAF9EF|nr:iron-sulfur cluster biosynthesis family protein [Alteribacter populi]
MNVSVTTEAQEQINSRITKCEIEGTIIEIEHDTDGCGCVVSGVARLMQRDQVPAKYETLHSNHERVLYIFNPQMKVFFDREMIIDYRNGRFQLKSANQMFNPRLKFVPLA